MTSPLRAYNRVRLRSVAHEDPRIPPLRDACRAKTTVPLAISGLSSYSLFALDDRDTDDYRRFYFGGLLKKVSVG